MRTRTLVAGMPVDAAAAEVVTAVDAVKAEVVAGAAEAVVDSELASAAEVVTAAVAVGAAVCDAIVAWVEAGAAGTDVGMVAAASVGWLVGAADVAAGADVAHAVVSNKLAPAKRLNSLDFFNMIPSETGKRGRQYLLSGV